MKFTIDIMLSLSFFVFLSFSRDLGPQEKLVFSGFSPLAEIDDANLCSHRLIP